jgi:hypothetical protein
MKYNTPTILGGKMLHTTRLEKKEKKKQQKLYERELFEEVCEKFKDQIEKGLQFQSSIGEAVKIFLHMRTHPSQSGNVFSVAFLEFQQGKTALSSAMLAVLAVDALRRGDVKTFQALYVQTTSENDLFDMNVNRISESLTEELESSIEFIKGGGGRKNLDKRMSYLIERLQENGCVVHRDMSRNEFKTHLLLNGGPLFEAVLLEPEVPDPGAIMGGKSLLFGFPIVLPIDEAHYASETGSTIDKILKFLGIDFSKNLEKWQTGGPGLQYINPSLVFLTTATPTMIVHAIPELDTQIKKALNGEAGYFVFKCTPPPQYVGFEQLLKSGNIRDYYEACEHRMTTALKNTTGGLTAQEKMDENLEGIFSKHWARATLLEKEVTLDTLRVGIGRSGKKNKELVMQSPYLKETFSGGVIEVGDSQSGDAVSVFDALHKAKQQSDKRFLFVWSFYGEGIEYVNRFIRDRKKQYFTSDCKFAKSVEPLKNVTHLFLNKDKIKMGNSTDDVRHTVVINPYSAKGNSDADNQQMGRICGNSEAKACSYVEYYGNKKAAELYVEMLKGEGPSETIVSSKWTHTVTVCDAADVSGYFVLPPAAAARLKKCYTSPAVKKALLEEIARFPQYSGSHETFQEFLSLCEGYRKDGAKGFTLRDATNVSYRGRHAEFENVFEKGTMYGTYLHATGANIYRTTFEILRDMNPKAAAKLNEDFGGKLSAGWELFGYCMPGKEAKRREETKVKSGALFIRQEESAPQIN